MSRIEEALLRRGRGARIVVFSLVLGLASYLPLQLYIWLGPKDGNPIGLGLLAVVGLPVALFGVAIGLVKMLVEHLGRKGG